MCNSESMGYLYKLQLETGGIVTFPIEIFGLLCLCSNILSLYLNKYVAKVNSFDSKSGP